MTSELLAICLLVLLLVLLVVLVLWWTLRRSRSRNLTELKISAGQPTRTLTIRTEPNHANHLLERLLDRVFVQVETESGDALGAEPGEEVRGRRGSHSGSSSLDLEPEVSTAAAVNPLQDKLWKWITIMNPPSATPPPPANQDQTNDGDLQQSDGAQQVQLKK